MEALEASARARKGIKAEQAVAMRPRPGKVGSSFMGGLQAAAPCIDSCTVVVVRVATGSLIQIAVFLRPQATDSNGMPEWKEGQLFPEGE